MKLVRLVGAALVLGAWFAWPAEAADRQVYIRAMAGPEGRFEAAPGSSGATINQGDRVYWENQDESTHNATGQGWSTGNIAPQGEASVVFNTPGTFNYSCTIHPSMTGSLQVRAVATTSPPPTTSPPVVTAAPMRPPPTTVRPATATTVRRTATTVRAATGATTTVTGGFDLLATTTTIEATTTTARELAIRQSDDDDGGADASTIAAAVLAPLVLLGGGGFLLYRLRARP